MNVWEKFDRRFDTKAMAKEVKEFEDNCREYDKVPFGRYEVNIDKLELIENKKGDPMAVVRFSVLTGEHKRGKIFYNQVLNKIEQIGIFNNFLRTLGTPVKIKYENYSQYGQMLEEIHDSIYGKLEYGLEYAETKNGYTTYNIIDIFELTQEQPKIEKKAVLEPVDDDEELPF